jgi:cell filamentation protein
MIWSSRKFDERHVADPYCLVHPFREGNGRTQRTFLRQLVAAAAWRIDWSGLNQQENIDASRRSLQTTETEPLQRLFEPLISQI